MEPKKSKRTRKSTPSKPPANGKKFTKDYQPAPAKKSEGWLRKKRGQELVQAVLTLAFKGMKDSTLKILAADYFGVPEDEITVEMMLHFRQAEKAIQKADTNAYNAVMARAFGAPKQAIEHSGAVEQNPSKMDELTFEQLYQLKYGHKPIKG